MVFRPVPHGARVPRLLVGSYGVTLARAVWRNPESTEGLIYLRSASLLNLGVTPRGSSETVTVATFAFRIKVIDGRSCLLTHIVEQQAAGLLADLYLLHVYTKEQLGLRMEGLAQTFQAGTQLDSFMLAETIREVDSQMLHLVSGFRVSRELPPSASPSPPTQAGSAAGTSDSRRTSSPAPALVVGSIGGGAGFSGPGGRVPSLPPASASPAPSEGVAASSAASFSLANVPDFEPPDPKSPIEVLISNRGRGLILISQARDTVKTFLTQVKRDDWKEVSTIEYDISLHFSLFFFQNDNFFSSFFLSFRGLVLSRAPYLNFLVKAVMGQGKVEASPRAILAALLETGMRGDWDPQTESVTVVEKINTQNRILYTCRKAGYMVSQRDIVTLESWDRIADNTFALVYSDIAHKTLPEKPNCVESPPHRSS